MSPVVTCHSLIRIAAALAILSGGSAFAAAKLSTTESFQEVALQPLLRGTWDWRFGKGDKGTISDIILSLDDRLNVVASATIVDGSLRLTPKLPPAPLILLKDTTTGIKSPERGSILIMPMQGILPRPARLLLRSVSDKKIECTDITDTANPVKVVMTKTSDRMIDDVAAAPLPAPAPPAAQPVIDEKASPPPPPTLAERAATDRHPLFRRGVMSAFERIKKELSEKPSPPPDEAGAPQPPAPPPKFVPEAPRAPVMSLYERLKSERIQQMPSADQAAAEEKPKPPSSLPPKFVPNASRTPVMSLYQRLKAEQEKNAETEKDGKARKPETPGPQRP